MSKPFIYVARRIPKGAPAYLPDGYKNRTNRTVEGVAETGEVSPKGTVAHTETWDGRVAAEAAPAAMRYIKTPDGIRRMTLQEMVERGYFILGKGPT